MTIIAYFFAFWNICNVKVITNVTIIRCIFVHFSLGGGHVVVYMIIWIQWNEMIHGKLRSEHYFIAATNLCIWQNQSCCHCEWVCGCRERKWIVTEGGRVRGRSCIRGDRCRPLLVPIIRWRFAWHSSFNVSFFEANYVGYDTYTLN